MKTRWTRPALADLEAIGDFVARDNPRAAERPVARIVAAIETLRDHPHLGRPGRVAGTRGLAVAETPYLVPYRVADGDVQILAVIHGARRSRISCESPWNGASRSRREDRLAGFRAAFRWRRAVAAYGVSASPRTWS